MEVLHAELDLNRLDRWTEEADFFVDPDGCKRYAAATNDTNPRHVSGELAPPIFAVVATVPHLGRGLRNLVPESSSTKYRGIHGEQDMFFHRPLIPGTTLRVRAQPIAVHQRPTGTAVISHAELRDVSGTLVQEQYITNYFRSVVTNESRGPEAPSHRMPVDAQLGDPSAAIRYDTDQNQTHRYAEASGDHTSYHVDESAARAAGFPGILLHGLCTMAFVSRAVVETVCEGDPTRLRRLAVRFSHPVFPSESITTTVWEGGRNGDHVNYYLETVNPASQPVITHGLAEVRDAGEGSS